MEKLFGDAIELLNQASEARKESVKDFAKWLVDRSDAAGFLDISFMSEYVVEYSEVQR